MTKKTFAALALLSCSLSAVGFYFFFLLGAPVSVVPAVEFEISPGEPASKVVERLAGEGVIRSPRIFLLMARMNGLDRAFRHGVHEFSGALTPEKVLAELVRPPRAAVRITIPEGLTWREIGRLLEENEIVAADDYYEAVCDPEFLRLAQVSPRANCAEGVLFPDTYDLTPGMTAREIARLQLRHFRQVMRELLAAHEDVNTAPELAAATEDPIGDPAEIRRITTMASVIEKETSVGTERDLVASVFYNRLRRGMKLQADPTVIYGLVAAGEEWDGTGLHKHLRIPSPYNSYTNKGLPPGPICNPGRAALEAAVEPAESDYLYFVAAGDGSHAFSTNLRDHNRAVARFRSVMNGRKP
jgi:UPF0755 protein